MRVVFMGTPDFAVRSLDILVENGVEVVGVITSVDKPAGRGNKVKHSAVKKYALDKGLNILQPKNLKATSFLEELKALKADLQIVVAFRMLPAVVFEMPPMGTVNLHASLLPQYRGAAPINWAVINGETETGVTTFFIEQEIDTGLMIFQDKTPIPEEMTAGELHDQLMEQGAQLVLKTVKAIESKEFPQEPQPTEGKLKKAPKIYKDTCKIDWTQSSQTVYNFIRGLSPYPAAYTFVGEDRFKIFKAKKMETKEFKSIPPGHFFSDNENFLYMSTADGILSIEDLQMAGKKRMKIKDFLRGYDF